MDEYPLYAHYLEIVAERDSALLIIVLVALAYLACVDLVKRPRARQLGIWLGVVLIYVAMGLGNSIFRSGA